MSIPIKAMTGHIFLEQDDLGIAQFVWDHAHPIYHKMGAGSGDVQPRFYPGVDKTGSVYLDLQALIKSVDPAHPDSGMGWDVNGDFIVKIDGIVVLRANKLGATFNGAIVQQNANPQYLPSREGLAALLFPLYNDKQFILQFNRPAFAAISPSNVFFAYQSLSGFLSDFNSTFKRGGSADGGSVRFVNGSLNYDYALSNQPRIVYSMSTGKCRGLLIEPLATNLAAQSFTLTSWPTNTGLILTQENVAAWTTKGLNTPYTFTETAANIEHSITQVIVGAPAIPTTLTFFYQAKAFSGTRRFTLFLANSDRSYLFGANFDAVSGGAPVFSLNRTVGNGAVSATSVEALGGGLYRIRVTGTVNSADNATGINLYGTFASLGDAPGNTTLVFTPGANTGGWCRINDFQIEQNPFATTYLQTAAVPLTRNPDVLSVNLSALKFSPVEGQIDFHFRTSNVAPVGTILFSLMDALTTTRLDFVITNVDAVSGIYTIGTNLYQPSLTTVSVANIGTVAIAKSKLTYSYTGLPASLISLIVDGSKGFFGTVSLISYE